MCKNRYGVIYLIRNKVNNKLYFGQTVNNFKRRYSGDLYSHTHNSYLKRAIDKYGIESFDIDEEFDIAYSKEELDKLEKIYIALYNTCNDKYGYNFMTGGNSSRHSEKTKEKISIACTGKNLGKDNPNHRPVVCLNTNEVFYSARDAARKYNIKSSGHINECCNKTIKTCGKLNEIELVWMYFDEYLLLNKKQKEQRIKEAYTKNFSKKYKMKPVICLNTGIIYKSICEASKITGCAKGHIISCCKGKLKSCGKDEYGNKLVWAYVNNL